MQGFHKEQVQDAIKLLSKYAHQAISGKEETIRPKGKKLSHLHTSLQNADHMRSLRRDMFDSRQTQQWNIESNWWDIPEGKEWLASQDMENATDFWNHFGVAHNYWTFDRMCEHRQTTELLGSAPKNDRAAKG